MAAFSFDANDRDKWSKGCGLEIDESVPGVAGRDIGGNTKKKEGERGGECERKRKRKREATGGEGRGRVPGVNL